MVDFEAVYTHVYHSLIWHERYANSGHLSQYKMRLQLARDTFAIVGVSSLWISASSSLVSGVNWLVNFSPLGRTLGLMQVVGFVYVASFKLYTHDVVPRVDRHGCSCDTSC